MNMDAEINVVWMEKRLSHRRKADALVDGYKSFIQPS